jgi:hypothetical protein
MIKSEEEGSSYSLKYVGVTNGEMGVLTTRVMLPKMTASGQGSPTTGKSESISRVLDYQLISTPSPALKQQRS